ncbi:type IV secretory system conjugative DNA transfer family protein [Cysteiniphilum sp. 6C5]|uniref:type IV secretory system conjugative DNA transfer family protein n=1 Tax=unclassified Cysteiniphilum TaxID=2610889 RepID=UPI003F854C9C
MTHFRGVTKSQETNAASTIRDTRSLTKRLISFVLEPINSVAIMLCLLMVILIVPQLLIVLIWLPLILSIVVLTQSPKLPFKLPIGARYKDYNNALPGQTKPGKAKGIYFFGNEKESHHELWFSNEDMRTHALIFGSTGSGKTETLVSLAYNALVQGSGFIYVDGKGDNALYAKIYSMARYLGREDDVLVINFMTGAKDISTSENKEEKLSNTLNPFAIGSSDMLSQLVVSMMSSESSGGGDGDMWKGRAISFVEALMRMLVYLRDQGYLLLEASLIRRYFVLDVVENFLYNKELINHEGKSIVFEGNIPLAVTDPMHNYLATLPGYQVKNVGGQSDKTYEQHGYITMQLTRVFGSLADVYAHIMKTELAEVDFQDVVLNRRILVVLLPALEKSPDELANLGKLIIASLKAMLASGLGNKIDGHRREVLDAKPSNSDTPFLCVLDEYGYYAVKGFAVVPAQARSLGFSVIFAGQDLPAFQKASKEEAASICANTNIKICMKLEDPQETWEFFNKTAGEAYLTAVKEFNMGDQGDALGYRDTRTAAVEKRSRVDLMDLKDQREGDAHIFFRSQIIRSRMFYANPKQTDEIKVNRFIKVPPLTQDKIQQLKAILSYSPSMDNDITLRHELGDSLKELFHKMTEDQEIDQKALVQQSHDSLAQNEQLLVDNMAQLLTELQKSATVINAHGQHEVNDTLYRNIPLSKRLDSAYYDVLHADFNDAPVSAEKIMRMTHYFALQQGIHPTKISAIQKRLLGQLTQVTALKYSPCQSMDEVYEKLSQITKVYGVGRR